MLARRFGFALGFALLVAPAAARAQAPEMPADDPSVLQFPLSGVDPFAITRIDRDGTITLELGQSLQPAFRMYLSSSIAEGYYLLMTNLSNAGGQKHFLRVQVTDVGAEGVVTVKASPSAASTLKVKDRRKAHQATVRDHQPAPRAA